MEASEDLSLCWRFTFLQVNHPEQPARDIMGCFPLMQIHELEWPSNRTKCSQMFSIQSHTAMSWKNVSILWILSFRLKFKQEEDK